MKSWMKMMHAVTLLGQFGFTFITPPVIMGLLGWWLQNRFGFGTWIMLVCLLLGLMTSFAGALQFYRKVMLQAKQKSEAQEPKEKPVMYYSHD